MKFSFETQRPQLPADAFVAPTAVALGNVVLQPQASIWYGSVLRGDVGTIRIGARSNVQDLSLVHTTEGAFDTDVGDDVTVGHRVVLHGCKVADHVLVGMGAVLMDDVHVGSYSIVGAGALVPPHKHFEPNVVLMGSPAKVVRATTDEEKKHIERSARRYVRLAAQHRAATAPID